MSDLGTARGRIVIDTAGVRAAQQEVQSASKAMGQALGAIGISVSVAGFVQLARAAGQFAIETTQIATAYNRQLIAAQSLAGGQAKLNELLQVYDKATGGAISQTEALANVTKLMAVGFADNAPELDKFARAIRGISIAMGTSQDTVTQNLILELFTQRGARLDQLGLQYDKVRQRADELQAADSSLTQQMAYQNAVLEQAQERFGALTDSAAGQAVGLEQAAKSWSNLKTAIGQVAAPGVNLAGLLIAVRLQQEINKLNAWVTAINAATQAVREFNLARTLSEAAGGGVPFVPNGGFAGGGGTGGGGGGGGKGGFGGPDEADIKAQNAAMVEWARNVQDIERQAGRDRTEATRQYEEQRTQTIRDYEKQITRDAEDFGRQRARAEQDFATSQQRALRDALQQEQRATQDLARSLAQREADSTETMVKARADANQRITELEADYNKSRERAQRDHQDRLMKAAGSLDAIALLEERKRFVRQQEDAKENFEAQRSKIQAQLGERLDQEAKALDKSIAQQKEAYDRQLEDARAANAQRIADQTADFDLRKAREDIDRGIRLERARQDHDEQLAELARQHGLHMAQIDQQVADQYRKLKESYDKIFSELKIEIDGYTAKLAVATRNALALFDALYGGTKPQQGPQPQNPLITPGQFPSLNSIAPANSSTTNNTRTSSVSISIYAQPGQDDKALVDAIVRALEGI